MTHIEKLKRKLESEGFDIAGITVGPRGTPENVAETILESLEEIERGNYEIVADIGG